MTEPARRIRPELPPSPEDLIAEDRASIKALGLKVDSWEVHTDVADEWHTVTYTVSRKRRKRDS